MSCQSTRATESGGNTNSTEDHIEDGDPVGRDEEEVLGRGGAIDVANFSFGDERQAREI